jgi:hypothetical protein
MKIHCRRREGLDSAIVFSNSVKTASRITSRYPPNHWGILELRQWDLPDSLTHRPLRPVTSSGVGYLQFPTHLAQPYVGDSILPRELHERLIPHLVVQLNSVPSGARMYRIGRTGFTVVGKSFGFCGSSSSHFWLQEELPQLAKAAIDTTKFGFRNPQQLGGSSRRRGRGNRSHDRDNTRILSP